MGSDPEEDKAKLPNKPITFVGIPDEVASFLDVGAEGEFYLRIESIEGRMVFPLGDEIETKLGALVDDYFTYL